MRRWQKMPKSKVKIVPVPSKKYAQIKQWYDDGRWSVRMVADAVKKGLITAAEYEQITGEPYDG